jgi:hypothetical protein
MNTDAPDPSAPSPADIETDPARSTSLDPLLTLNDPLDETEEEPVCTEIDPAPPDALESSADPPGPLDTSTEPPSADEPIPPTKDRDPPTKPEPETAFNEPPVPPVIDDADEPATNEISPALIWEVFEELDLEAPSTSPDAMSTDPLDPPTATPLDNVTDPDP